jgi:hypothetical protein
MRIRGSGLNDKGTGMASRAPQKANIDGELLILWAMPVVWLIWFASFLAFPGFVTPMSPRMTAQEVSAFYFDPTHLSRIRYSMIVFNWFGVALIPMLAMLAMQIHRMAHRTPILTYCFVGCIAGGPTLFCMADLFWLLAAFRPDRDPHLVQMFNDMAWVTFTSQVPFLIAQNVILAMSIYLDRQKRPVFPAWIGHFNLVSAAAMAPAAFAAVSMDGALAWDGALSFWTKNISISLWIVVMTLALGRNVMRQRREADARA